PRNHRLSIELRGSAQLTQAGKPRHEAVARHAVACDDERAGAPPQATPSPTLRYRNSMQDPRSIALALLSAALFGAATPASKLLLADLTPLQLAGLLYLGAALAMVDVRMVRDDRPPIRVDAANRWRLAG